MASVIAEAPRKDRTRDEGGGQETRTGERVSNRGMGTGTTKDSRERRRGGITLGRDAKYRSLPVPLSFLRFHFYFLSVRFMG